MIARPEIARRKRWVGAFLTRARREVGRTSEAAGSTVTRGNAWSVACVVLVLAAAGCAPIPAMVLRPGATVPRADSTRVTPGTRPATRPGTPVVAVVDSAPSSAALGVLASIPEPIAPEERVPAPEVAPVPVDAPILETAPADSAAPVPADTTDEIPVPSPTPKLGDIVNPGLDPARDTTAARVDTAGVMPELPKPGAPRTTPATAPARVPPPTTTAPAPACWRVQILAPKEKAEANRKRAAAESILLVPMVIERDGGLYKIRTRECFARATADIVRGRAVASGFAGAFPFEGAKR